MIKILNRLLTITFVILSITLVILFLLSCKNDTNVNSIEIREVNGRSLFKLSDNLIEIQIEYRDKYGDKIEELGEAEFSLLTEDGENCSDCLVITSSQKVHIDVNRLSRLGDYKLCAKILDIVGEYNFTVDSTSDFDGSFEYSYVKVNEDLLKEKNIDEYNYAWQKIAPSERMTLMGDIKFTPLTNKTGVYITLQEDKKKEFGNLEIEMDEEREDVILLMDERGLFLFGDTREEESVFTFFVKAGGKKKKEINVKLNSPSPTLQITAPIFSSPTDDEKAGKRINITGDKVSNTYLPITDGNDLTFKIYRSRVENCTEKDDTFSEISALEIIKGSEKSTGGSIAYLIPIEYGYTLYLPYAGSYLIESTITSFDSSACSSLMVNVPYKSITHTFMSGDVYVSSLNSFPTLKNAGELQNLNDGYEAPLRVLYTINGVNTLEKGNINIIKKFTSFDSRVASTTERITLSKNERTGKEGELKWAGQYEITAFYEDIGGGWGNIPLYDEEYYKEKIFKEDREIYTSPFSDFLKGESSENGDNITFTYRFNGVVPKNAKVYYTRQDKNGRLVDAGTHSLYEGAVNPIIAKITEPLSVNTFTFKALIYIDGSYYESDIEAIKLGGIPNLKSKAVILDIPDDWQSFYDERAVCVSGSMDIYGNGRRLYYCWSTSSNPPASGWTYLGNSVHYSGGSYYTFSFTSSVSSSGTQGGKYKGFLRLKTPGTQYLHIKTMPTSREISENLYKGYTITTAKITLERLPKLECYGAHERSNICLLVGVKNNTGKTVELWGRGGAWCYRTFSTWEDFKNGKNYPTHSFPNYDEKRDGSNFFCALCDFKSGERANAGTTGWTAGHWGGSFRAAYAQYYTRRKGYYHSYVYEVMYDPYVESEASQWKEGDFVGEKPNYYAF